MTMDEIEAMLRAVGGSPAALSADPGGIQEHTIMVSPGLVRRYIAAREEVVWSDIDAASA